MQTAKLINDCKQWQDVCGKAVDALMTLEQSPMDAQTRLIHDISLMAAAALQRVNALEITVAQMRLGAHQPQAAMPTATPPMPRMRLVVD